MKTTVLTRYFGLLANYLRPERSATVLLGILVAGGIVAQLAAPQLMGRFIDLIQTGASSSGLIRVAVLFVVAALARQALAALANYVGAGVGWRATNALRVDLLHHCLNLDMAFHAAHPPGEMVERIDSDVSQLAQFFSQFVIQVLANMLLVVGVLGVLIKTDWRAGAAVAVFTLASAVAVGPLTRANATLWADHRERVADLYAFLQERMAGTEDIQACGAKGYVMRQFHRVNRAEMRQRVKAGAIGAATTHNVTELLFALGVAGALAAGAALYSAGSVTIGTVYIIYSYSAMLAAPIRHLTRQIRDLQRAGGSIERIRELMLNDTHLEQATVDDLPVPVSGLIGVPEGEPLSVEFQAVSFRYPDDARGILPDAGTEEHRPTPDGGIGQRDTEAVLKGLSFRLEPGQILGLLGRTGSGKTTIARLLLRLYSPDTGAISICGRGGHPSMDIQDIPLGVLRSRIGLVTQDVQVFRATVRDNLTLFDPTVADDRLLDEIDQLGLWSWYSSLPQGLDTRLEPGGRGLSAGEAQLLAFLRILLRDPGLVILDEASSRLDPATERLIERAVDRLVADRTAIIIAHRLSTVARADVIMILDGGIVVEQGLRERLAAEPTSHFRRLLETGMEEVLR